MLRNISVSWQKMQGAIRVIKVTGAPRVSYWELKTPNGNSLGISPANTLGILTFDTSFSGAVTLVPVTLRGSAYRNGISVSAVPAVPVIGGSYSITPPATLSGSINAASGSFSVGSSGITVPMVVSLSSSLAGSFSPFAITLPLGSAAQSFTYTPTVAGNHVISFSSPLTNPGPITYVASSPIPPSPGGNLILDTQFVTLTAPLTIPLGGTSNYVIRHVTTTLSSVNITFSGAPTQDMRVEIWNRSEPGRIVSVLTPPDNAVAALNTGLGESKLTLDYDLTSNTWYGVITNG